MDLGPKTNSDVYLNLVSWIPVIDIMLDARRLIKTKMYKVLKKENIIYKISSFPAGFWSYVDDFGRNNTGFVAFLIDSLTTLPSALGSLTSLSQLHISNNMLTSLPNELGLLNQLQVLKANNNRYILELVLSLIQ